MFMSAHGTVKASDVERVFGSFKWFGNRLRGLAIIERDRTGLLGPMYEGVDAELNGILDALRPACSWLHVYVRPDTPTGSEGIGRVKRILAELEDSTGRLLLHVMDVDAETWS